MLEYSAFLTEDELLEVTMEGHSKKQEITVAKLSNVQTETEKKTAKQLLAWEKEVGKEGGAQILSQPKGRTLLRTLEDIEEHHPIESAHFFRRHLQNKESKKFRRFYENEIQGIDLYLQYANNLHLIYLGGIQEILQQECRNVRDDSLRLVILGILSIVRNRIDTQRRAIIPSGGPALVSEATRHTNIEKDRLCKPHW